MFWYEGVAEGMKPVSCFDKTRPKIPILCRTSPSI